MITKNLFRILLLIQEFVCIELNNFFRIYGFLSKIRDTLFYLGDIVQID